MANAFNPTEAAKIAVKMAEKDAFLSALVNRDLEQEFLSGNGKGNVVNVRIPGTLSAHVRGMGDKASEIQLDEIAEDTFPVSLGDHIYSAVGLSERDMNLDIENFSVQVLSPQVDAVVEQIEHIVAEELLSIEADSELSAAYDPTDPVKTLTALRKALRKRGVSQNGLRLVVGTDVYADLLDKDLLTAVNTSGTSATLREGNVGRVRGFEVVESTRVGDGDIIAFHKDAFTLAVRAPMVPQGITGGVQSSNGFSLRVMRDYDTRHACVRSLVGTFAGVTAMPLYMNARTFDELTETDAAMAALVESGSEAVRTGSSELVEVVGGAAIRIDTTDAGSGSADGGSDGGNDGGSDGGSDPAAPADGGTTNP